MSNLPAPETFTTSPIFSPLRLKPRSPYSWPISLLPNPVPTRYRRRLRSKLNAGKSPASSIAAVETSFSPYDSIQALRTHRWTPYDLQYILLSLLAIFSLLITPAPSPILKLGMVVGYATLLLVPVTRQFFLPFAPIGTWLIFFFSCRFIPSEYRPGIWVRVLPALENIFYGANLSNILSAHKHAVLDVLAWLPYGITHFGAPFVCSAIMFVFAAPGTVAMFARTFGYMNLTGVVIQILFPCAAPWYENMYGLAPANYAMDGSPAGLARIDALFGLDMYTTTFTNSPLVFGAFPSLHSANAVLEALFMSFCFPKLRPFFIAYALWLWWATMYLSHHYAVDLVGGGMIAAIYFYITKSNYLPRRQADKTLRWDYDFVEYGDAPDSEDRRRFQYEYMMDELEVPRGSTDAWGTGSSSSISSGARSPPTEQETLWEGETLASDEEKTGTKEGFSPR